MKQTSVIILLTFFFWPVLTHAQLDTNGLIAHWPFNGNLNDSTGRGHNASLFYYTTGTPPQVYRPGINGVAGSSFQFRSDFQMQAPYQPDLKLDSFTVAAVVNFDTLNAYSTILFGKSIYGISSEASYGAAIYKPNSTSNYCFLPKSDQAISYNQYNNFQYHPSAQDSTWYYVVVTYDGDTFKTYVNGALKTAVIAPRPFPDTSNAGLYIGGYFDTWYLQFTARFMGVMDDLRLYNRPLSYDEIVTYPFNFYDTTVVLNMSAADSVKCAGTGLNVKYLVSRNFRNTNVFTVQMSDATGSFTTPVQIGRDSTNISGTISCVIPTTTAPGRYAIRLISSAPADTTFEYYFNYHPAKNLGAKTFGQIALSSSYYPPQNGICQGDSMLFRTDSLVGLGITPATYQWQKNGANIPGANNADYSTRAISDNDSFRCVLTSNHACWTGDTVYSSYFSVQVDTIPAIITNISVSPDDSICIGDTATFYITGTNVGTANAVWWHIKNKPTLSFPGSNDTLIYSGARHKDTFYCTFTSFVTCAPKGRLSSNYLTMHVDSNIAPPKVSITANPGNTVPHGTDITFTANATDTGTNPSYQWRKNSVPIPGATGKTYLALYPSLISTDRVSVVVKNTTNKCVDTDSTVSTLMVLFTSGIGNISFDRFSVYPNPNHGHFILQGSMAIQGPVRVSIADVVGRTVHSDIWEQTPGQWQKNINLQDNIPPGVYILKITANEETQYLSLLLQK